MADIRQFPNQNDSDSDENIEEDYCCPTCEMIDDFSFFLFDAENIDEIRAIVTDLVNEAKDLGYKQALINDALTKIEIVEEWDKEQD